MFERYTEKARRVIFFARYAASQFGGPNVEVEHLLLGLLREDTAVAARLSRSPLSPETLRKRIETESPHREKIPTSVDMPLSSTAKTALTHATEEAERVAHEHIGTEHLLLGIQRQETTLAAKLAGFEIPKIREDLCRADRHPGRKGEHQPKLNKDCVEIHGELWNANSVRELGEYYGRFHWEKRRWVKRAALVRRSDRTLYLYTGQPYDPEQFDLVKDRWSEDHCAICWWKLTASDTRAQGEGLTNGQDWLCTECFERFVSTTRPADS